MAKAKTKKSRFSVEVILNRWVQKLFPVWYACEACKEVELVPLGQALNPPSFLHSRWIDVVGIINQIDQSLADDDVKWGAFKKLLDELIVVRQVRRNLNIDLLSGVVFSEHREDYVNLLAYAQNHCEGIEVETSEHFENNLQACFPKSEQPIQVGYREWDGRYYWKNEAEPTYLGALILQNSVSNKRDVVVPAEVQVERFKSSIIDQITNQYWVIVMHQDSSALVDDLLSLAGFDKKSVIFSPNHPQLRLLIFNKKSKTLNRAILNLLLSHSHSQVLDLFRYLQRTYKPLK